MTYEIHDACPDYMTGTVTLQDTAPPKTPRMKISDLVDASRQQVALSNDEAAVSKGHSIIRTFVNTHAALDHYGTSAMRFRMALEMASHEAGSGCTLTAAGLADILQNQHTQFRQHHANLTAERETILETPEASELRGKVATLRNRLATIETLQDDMRKQLDVLETEYEEVVEAKEAAEHEHAKIRNENGRAQQIRLTAIGRNIQRIESNLAETRKAQAIYENIVGNP